MRRGVTVCSCGYSYQQPKRIGEFSQQEKKHLYIFAAVLVVISLAGMALIPGVGGVALYRQHQETQTAEGVNSKLQTDNELGQKSLAAAQKNPELLEGVARAQFNLIRPDEVILDYSKKK